MILARSQRDLCRKSLEKFKWSDKFKPGKVLEIIEAIQ